ncbi:nickel-dependent lactate racemase [bacterium]|nr:MAG: nickel-dependent lactate racemase [bacterium]
MRREQELEEIRVRKAERRGSPEEFYRFLEERERILFVVNDHTRPTPTRKILESAKEYLEGKDISFLIATGTHRSPTQKEIEEILGDFKKYPVYIHDAKNSSFIHCGKTSRGTPVYLNKIVLEHPCVVNITSVEPHYFAGITGGRKSYIPGISAYETIEKNHSLAMEPEALPLKLEGNPVHEDMVEGVKLAGKEFFSLNLVQWEKEVVGYFFGECLSSLSGAYELAKRIYLFEMEKVDAVIAEVYPPLSKNLYQAHKGIENVKEIVRDGGVILLVADLEEGTGPSHFYDMLKERRLPEKYCLGMHKAKRMMDLMKRVEIWCVSSMGDRLKEIGFVPFPGLEDALEELFKRYSKILRVRDAGRIVVMPHM